MKMQLTFAHYRILWRADSSNLPELLLSMKSHGFSEDELEGPDFEWPELPLSEARAALADLVAAGYIDVIGEEDKSLSIAEAMRAVNNEHAWQNSMPDTPNYYEIYVTPRGAQTLKRLHSRFRHVGRVRKD